MSVRSIYIRAMCMASAPALCTSCVQPPPPIAVCPVVAQLPAQTQDRIADEAEALPAGAYLRELVLPDWIRMRDEARAICGLERMKADDD